MDQNADNSTLKQQLVADGDTAFDAGDYSRALDFYHRASLLDNADSAVWTAIGLTFSNLDFPRESWRSYLLALNMDPRNANALWYASEFLFDLGDLPLADLFLGHYLNVEQDAEKLAEARQLRDEIHAEAQARGIVMEHERDAEAAAVLEGDGSSDTLERLDQSTEPDPTEEEEVAPSLQLSDEELEEQAMLGERFVPQLALRLLGFDGLCQHCSLRIPYDAPYCWSCKMIHFYE